MDEVECLNLVKGSHEIWQMKGGVKGPAKEEQVTMDFAFATVCSIFPIKKGETFTRDNIWVKRPGTGEILAEEFNAVLGKTATSNIARDVQIKKADISP